MGSVQTSQRRQRQHRRAIYGGHAGTVHPGTQNESPGVIVEDFGEMAAQPVDLGGQHFADPARRWAARLYTGNLVFADTDQLVAE